MTVSEAIGQLTAVLLEHGDLVLFCADDVGSSPGAYRPVAEFRVTPSRNPLPPPLHIVTAVTPPWPTKTYVYKPPTR